MHEGLITRHAVDNVHVIYYLHSWDTNYQPKWAPLTNANILKNRSTPLFCKLKRFSSSDLRIGNGINAQKEIISKYFYLMEQKGYQ